MRYYRWRYKDNDLNFSDVLFDIPGWILLNTYVYENNKLIRIINHNNTINNLK